MAETCRRKRGAERKSKGTAIGRISRIRKKNESGKQEGRKRMPEILFLKFLLSSFQIEKIREIRPIRGA